MNKAYRVVLNKATGAWTAVSEIACGRGKGHTAVQVAIAALIAGAGVFATSGAVAQTVSGGLQLCTVGGLGVGAGTSLGSGGLDRPAAKGWPDGRVPNIRWILVHMIEEYARHNGHADLIRESTDGETGE